MRKICGSTMDHSEIIVDFKANKENRINIKGTPPETLYNRLKSAFFEWVSLIIGPYAIIVVFLVVVVPNSSDYMSVQTILGPFIGINLVCTSLHIHPGLDGKIKTWFVKRTGDRKRNKVRVSEFKSNVFVLYDIKNIVIEFNPSGDVEKQLSKIWVKEEHPCSRIMHQAKVNEFLFLEEDKPQWNAYFYFDKVPKDGELYLEWV